MHRPRIGIPLSLDDRGRWRAERTYHYIDQSYADAIDRAGGVALHLPIQSDVASLVASIDGLLLPGGDDFPSETPLAPEIEALLDLVPTAQVAFDRMLFEAARERGLPVLGICYGMQLMAITAGGKLDAHLPSQRPDAGPHKLAPDARHPVAIVPGSRLAAIAGADSMPVNSLHHQGVRAPGRGQRIAARSADGVIEAIESDAASSAAGASAGATASGESPFLLGVQWHPEKQRDAFSERLFAAFIDAARRGARNRRDPTRSQSRSASPGATSR
ncbi:MAG: gamma-glutamyl-gamma-aminobutyrate hydrolase family protein [Deltaproteobacteria bacterium]|nr:gamma-glutamyl-gamma-aminobutyrate hydrolase family protein [Deltaproteobacteria bacterium]